MANFSHFDSQIEKITRMIPETRLERIPIPVLRNPVVDNSNDNLASTFHRQLMNWINTFDASLNSTDEVGVRLVSFGQSITFTLREMGYSNPSLISFSGHLESGSPVELIQHVSQISILLMAVKRLHPDQPKRPIGFHAVALGEEKHTTS